MKERTCLTIDKKKIHNAIIGCSGLTSTFQNQLPALGPGGLTAGPSFSVQIGTVNLSRDYDFNRLMADIENFRAGKRVQRGIVTL